MTAPKSAKRRPLSQVSPDDKTSLRADMAEADSCFRSDCGWQNMRAPQIRNWSSGTASTVDG
jgi:hypothetical protein